MSINSVNIASGSNMNKTLHSCVIDQKQNCKYSEQAAVGHRAMHCQ